MLSIRVPVKKGKDGSRFVGEKTIEPWNGLLKRARGKNQKIPLWKWCKDDRVLTVEVREIDHAVFDRVEPAKAVMPDGEEIPYEKAVFFDMWDSRVYDISSDMIGPDIKVKDHVRLMLFGCCSIINVELREESDLPPKDITAKGSNKKPNDVEDDGGAGTSKGKRKNNKKG